MSAQVSRLIRLGDRCIVGVLMTCHPHLSPRPGPAPTAARFSHNYVVAVTPRLAPYIPLPSPCCPTLGMRRITEGWSRRSRGDLTAVPCFDSNQRAVFKVAPQGDILTRLQLEPSFEILTREMRIGRVRHVHQCRGENRRLSILSHLNLWKIIDH